MYYNPFLPQQEVMRVNGEAGARNVRLAPNSSLLAIDENAPLVWLITTDGGGYSTIKSYEIKERVEKTLDYDAIMTRLERIEEKLNESNAKSDDSEE